MVSRSLATVAIDTFMTEVSRAMQELAGAQREEDHTGRLRSLLALRLGCHRGTSGYFRLQSCDSAVDFRSVNAVFSAVNDEPQPAPQ